MLTPVQLAAASAALVLGATTPGHRAPAARPHASTPHVVHVTAQDYAFQAPDTIPAGAVTFALANHGRELHHITLLRLAAGKTMADLATAMHASHGEAPPQWAEPMGGPNGIAPGGEAQVSMMLPAGNYALICMIPSPDGTPTGTPHVMKGMMHALTAVSSAADAPASALPAADEHVTLADYTFTLTHPLTAGPHVVSVSNVGSQPHEIQLVRLAPGKTPQDVIQWVMKPQGPPPGEPVGGVSPLAPGRTSSFTATITPGDYGFICFLPDAKDMKPHFMHGMIQTVHVP